MKKLLTILLISLAIAVSGNALAGKKPKKTDTPAGPEPTISVSTDCVRADNGVEVNKYFAGEVPPDMKNAALAVAIGIADFQVTADGPVNQKAYCAVTRTTPSGIVQLVYEAFAE